MINTGNLQKLFNDFLYFKHLLTDFSEIIKHYLKNEYIVKFTDFGYKES